MGAYSTHTQLLVELHSCLQLHPRRDPNQHLCSSAEPSQWPCLAYRLTWQLCLIWVPRQLALIFLGLHREADAQPCPTAEHCLHPTPPGSLAREPRQPWSPSNSLLGQEAKPVALPTAGHSLWPCIAREPEQ